MRMHVVDGAEILRRTPEMPAIAPVIAFEHHLRLDGTGYPFGVSRSGLNVGTMLCSIADVYDAMRSQRAYQQAFPSDRILEVMKRSDGQQFDQHLVRRFTQLLGIYPPGNLVRLDDGALGGGDGGARAGSVQAARESDRHAERASTSTRRTKSTCGKSPTEAPGPKSVKAPLDPAEHGIDPLDVSLSNSKLPDACSGLTLRYDVFRRRRAPAWARPSLHSSRCGTAIGHGQLELVAGRQGDDPGDGAAGDRSRPARSGSAARRAHRRRRRSRARRARRHAALRARLDHREVQG